MKQFALPLEPDPAGGILNIQGNDFHYLIRVRRYRSGDSVSAISPAGRHFRMDITEVDKDSLTVHLDPLSPSKDSEDRNSDAISITLMPSITKGKKMDLAVRQAVEAGAFRIQPLMTEHSQVKLKSSGDIEAKTDRWNRIATEALQQCGGNIPSKVMPAMKLNDVLKEWNKRGPVLFFHEKPLGGKTSLHGHLAVPLKEMAIIIGPEGGLSQTEVELLESWGAAAVHLGQRILRAETAAIYALAAVQTIIREKEEWQPA